MSFCLEYLRRCRTDSRRRLRRKEARIVQEYCKNRDPRSSPECCGGRSNKQQTSLKIGQRTKLSKFLSRPKSHLHVSMRFNGVPFCVLGWRKAEVQELRKAENVFGGLFKMDLPAGLRHGSHVRSSDQQCSYTAVTTILIFGYGSMFRSATRRTCSD